MYDDASPSKGESECMKRESKPFLDDLIR
jgi:hypothetical protein